MGQTRTHDSTAPLGVKLVCVLIAVSAGIAFFYRLWFVERWAWFAGIALFGIGAFLALLRIFLVNDAVAVAEFFLDTAIVAYLVSKKPVYAPRVRWN